MNIVSVPLAVLRLQYKIVRFPLQLIEDQFMSRLGTEAPARVMYERTLGVIDGAVGSVLGDQEVEQRGAALTKRSDALLRAAELDAEASRKAAEADAELEAERQRANEQQVAAQEAKQREVEQARKREEERKRTAAQEAEQRKQAAAKQADEQAAQRKQAAEAAARNEREKIKAAEEKAAAPAKEQLQEAADKQSEAADKRARADRVEDLAESEAANRKNEKAAGS